MTGQLTHTPSEITLQVLLDLTLGTDWSADDDWPVTFNSMPDSPDDFITVYDTAGQTDGRVFGGEIQEHEGVQIRIRSAAATDGYAKISAIIAGLDAVLRRTVNIDSSVYQVQCFNRTSTILSLGKDAENERRIHTVNYTVTVRQTS